ncbi:MAG: hypothetical protein K2G88_10365, partial [Oscillospiraceae bacterium]|nr:hypothetical protein [Oscillospiraceae bacterium]
MYLINNSKNQEEYFAYLDKIIFITSLSKCDEGNTLWRYYIKDKINKLSMCGEYDLALNIAIGAYNEVYETSVPNETLFDITSDLAKAYFIAQKFLYVNDSRKREEIQDMRVVLYDKMLRMADAFWGDHSFNYGITKYKIANLNLGMGEELNIENGKNLLIEAFDIITLPENLTLNQSWDIVEVITQSVNTFDIANANDEFLLYAERIINAYESESIIDLSKLREAIAQSLNSVYGDIEKKRKSLDIYTTLIDNSKSEKDCLSYLKSRASIFKSLKDYKQSLCDYLSVDSIYKLEQPKNFMDESSIIDNYLNIAELYYSLNDTINCKKYSKLYCSTYEDLIGRITTGNIAKIEYPTIDDIKIELVESYINAISFGTDLGIGIVDYAKAIKYSNMLLDFIEHTEPSMKTINEHKRHTNYILSQIYILQEDFTNAFAVIDRLIKSSIEDNDFNSHVSGLGQLASLYGRVSIEPELSLQYRLQACELLSERLISNKQNMFKEEYLTSIEMISHSWEMCADDYEYLGDAGSAEICHQRNLYYMERLEGMSSYYYANALYSYLAHYKIPYYHYKTRDIAKAKMCLDTLASYYQINKQVLDPQYTTYDYCSIGRDYFYLEDSIKAKKYYDAFELELKDKNPDNYQLSQEYLELLKCNADLLEGENRLNTLKEIEILCEDDRVKFAYEPIKSMTYSSVLHDIAN